MLRIKQNSFIKAEGRAKQLFYWKRICFTTCVVNTEK